MFIHQSLYTHILPDGTNLHIDASAVRRLLLEMQRQDMAPRTVWVNIDQDQFWSMLAAKQFDPLRCIELAKRNPWYLSESQEPLIWCLWGRGETGIRGGETEAQSASALSGFLMDGHHRYALAAVRGLQALRTWVVPESVWRHFLVDGLPNLTPEELRDLPPTHRSY